MIHDGECPCECAPPFLDPPAPRGSGQVYLGDRVQHTSALRTGRVTALQPDGAQVAWDDGLGSVGNRPHATPFYYLRRLGA